MDPPEAPRLLQWPQGTMSDPLTTVPKDSRSSGGLMVLTLELPLTLTLPCRASPGARPARHPVVVEQDWSVRTGHDATLERIAAAFGGGVSCLPLLAGALPGLREWRERARRTPGLLIRSSDRGATWHTAGTVHPCCPVHGYADPRQAGAHVRGAAHVAAETGAPRRALLSLIAGLGERAEPALPVHVGLGTLGSDSVAAEAWECGLAPEWVAPVRVMMSVAGLVEVPVNALLAIAQSGADPGWVADTAARFAAGRPDDPSESVLESTADWLAWTATDLDRRLPSARADWLATGARRVDIVVLSEAQYEPRDAADVARDWQISLAGAAQVLARWVGTGYTPTPQQLRSVRDAGVTFPQHPPARTAVERIVTELHRDPGRSRPARTDGTGVTELAVALARCGTVRDTVAVLRRGGDVGPPC